MMIGTLLLLSLSPVYSAQLTPQKAKYYQELDEAKQAFQRGDRITREQNDLLTRHRVIGGDDVGILEFGGPDAAGYFWADSDEPDGPEYNWIDISGTGTPITGWSDDVTLGPFDIGFDFPFYGEEYAEFYLCSNGFLSFTYEGWEYWNQPIPIPEQPNNCIYWFWTDLFPWDQSTAYYEVVDGNLIVQIMPEMWDGMDVQIILQPDGVITLQYGENFAGWNENEIIGIENQDGTTALMCSAYNVPADYPYAGMALKIWQEEGTASIQGTVTDSETGDPLPDVEIRLGALGTTTTDELGHYSYEDIFPGMYSITGRKEGYFRRTLTCEVLDGDNTCDFTMDPLPMPGYSVNFDETNEGWWSSPFGSVDCFEWGAPTIDPDEAHSEPNVWAINLDGNFAGEESFDTLYVAGSHLIQDQGAFVSMWLYWVYEVWDQGFTFQISGDNGETWDYLEPEGGYPEDYIWPLGGPGFNNNSGFDWSEQIFPIPDMYLDMEVRFRFLHGAMSWEGNTHSGMAVDDFMIIGTPVPALFTGTISNSDGQPIEGATAYIYDSATGEMINSFTTEADGVYSIYAPEGTYDLSATAYGYITSTIEDIVAEQEGEYENDFTLQDQTTNVVITGNVMSADVPDTPVAGMVVSIPALGIWGISDGTGAFDLGTQLEGTYDFSIASNPVGINGYHDIYPEGVHVTSATVPLTLYAHPILPPQTVIPNSGDHQVMISWQPPANHETAANLAIRADLLRVAVERLRGDNSQRARERLQQMEQNLFAVENRLRALENGELDELIDFAGYRIEKDGTILDDIVYREEFTATGLQNGQEYTFRVAADYGYGENYLVWSDPVSARPFPSPTYSWMDEVVYDWVDIRPEFDGEGTALNLGDNDFSEFIDMGGLSFNFYGNDFTSIGISANGVVSFTDVVSNPWGDWFPSEWAPNNLIGPYWTDLDPGQSDEEDVWYWADTDEGLFYVLWYTGSYPGPFWNTKLFEIILDTNDNSITFQYNSSEQGWQFDEWAVIGFEDETGTHGLNYEFWDIFDGLALKAQFFNPDWETDYFNIIGTLTDSETDEPLEDALITLVDGPEVRTNALGHYTIPLLYRPDWTDFTVEARANGYQLGSVENVNWIEGEFEVVVDIAVTPVTPETPPNIIHVADNYDKGVNLVLTEPGVWGDVAPDIWIQYDDGEIEDAYFVGGGPETIILTVPFLLDGPALLTYSEIRLPCELDPFWPWPDDVHDPIIALVFASDNGSPGELLWTSDPVANTEENPFVEIEPFLPATEGVFVGFHLEGQNGVEGLCLDGQNNQDVMFHMSWDGGENWESFIPWGDPVLRAAFISLGDDVQLVQQQQQPTDPRRERPNRRYAHETHPVWGFGSSSYARPVPRDRGLRHVSELDEFLGFNIYYSLDNGGNWAISNDELVTDPIYFTEIGSVYENDENILVRATAMLDVDGDQIESDSSTPQQAFFNDPPAAPMELHTTDLDPENNQITIAWSEPESSLDGSELVDLEGYKVFRDGQFLAELTGTSYVDVVPEPAFYSYYVTAFDEVPNEGPPSNNLNVLVGIAPFYTDFEADAGPLEGEGDWMWGEPSTGPNEANSGENCWATNLDGFYSNSADDMLRILLPWTVVSENAQLVYYHWYDYEEYWDGYNVQISTNGIDYNRIDPIGGYPQMEVVGLDQDAGFSGSQEGWQQVVVPLGDYVGSVIYLAFRSGSDEIINEFDGCYLDDIALFGITPPAYGSLSGTVTDCNGDPLSGITVTIPDAANLTTQTMANGTYSFEEVLVGNWTVFASHDNYWTDEENVEIVVDQESVVDFELTYPEADVSTTSLELQVFIGEDDPDRYYGSIDFDLLSEGCGPLDWNASIEIVSVPDHWDNAPLSSAGDGHGIRPEDIFSGPKNRDRSRMNVAHQEGELIVNHNRVPRGPIVGVTELDVIWDELFSLQVDQVLQNYVYNAVTVDWDNIYSTASWDPTVYHYTSNGEYLGSWQIDDQLFDWEEGGIRDMAYDPETGYFYGGRNNGNLYRFTIDMSEVTLIGNTGHSNYAVGYDWDDEYIYTATWNSNFGRMDQNGNYENLGNVPEDCTGLAYMPADEEGYTIWAFTQFGMGEEISGYIWRYDPENNVWHDEVHQIFTSFWGASAGLNINYTARGDIYDITTVYQENEGQMLVEWEGLPRVTWLNMNPTEGWLDPSESSNIVVEADLNETGLEEYILHGDFVEANITITAAHLQDEISIYTYIEFIESAGETGSELPGKYELYQNYPNPFNPTTSIRFDLIENQQVKLTVYNLLGQEVARLVDAPFEAGKHSVNFDAKELSSGVYFYRIDTPAFNRMRKMILIK